MSADSGQPSDDVLLDRFMAGDPTALDALAARYDEKLAAFLTFLVGDYHQANDLLDNLWTEIYLSKGRRCHVALQVGRTLEAVFLGLSGHLFWDWLGMKERGTKK